MPELQKDLHLSESAVQWVINGYLVALAALFAFGGRIADIAGHKRMVLIGIGSSPAPRRSAVPPRTVRSRSRG